MKMKEPFFMKNPEWYTFNEEKCKLELTEQAPQEAIDSYIKFYAFLDSFEKNSELVEEE